MSATSIALTVEESDVDELDGTSNDFARPSEACYDGWGAEGNPRELVLRHEDAQGLGARIFGRRGLLLPPRGYIAALAVLTLWALAQACVSHKIVTILAARWLGVMLWRRPTMTVSEQVWKWLEKLYHDAAQLPTEMLAELLCAAIMVPLMVSDGRASLDEDAFCSGASERGGSVCIARY